MGFFDVPIPEWPSESDYEPPVWAGPPRGVLPGYSPQRAVVFRTDKSLFVVDRFLAFPTGIRFTATVWVCLRDGGLIDVPWELHSRPMAGDLPNDFLRFGILLADGSKWTNLDWRYPSEDDEPQGPIVTGQGGGGGGDSWEMDYWMWPLAPLGSMSFVASWPAFQIAESTANVDATEIRARADDAEVLWSA